jgi:hypothetical protein
MLNPPFSTVSYTAVVFVFFSKHRRRKDVAASGILTEYAGEASIFSD